ncbi:sigma-70 family RNA polymerase sigma factor [Bacillus sp. AK031]
MMRDDKILIKRAKKGDDEAFYKLITLHRMQLYRIALSYFKNEHDAVEAIQETTFRAYKGLKKLKKTNYFSTWLIRILLNYCHDELKKKKRFVYDERLLNSTEGSFEKSALEVEEAINRLDEKYKRVIVLKYLQGMKISEIADVLDHPEGTIKTWLHKGLIDLRNHLGEDEEGDKNVRA